MVICVLKDLVLDDNVVLEHTTFEISKHQSFKELELTSANNKKSRTMCIFNHVLDPNIKWYARARCLLSTGMTVWGNVDTFESIVDTDYIDSIDMPSRVGVPQITTNSLQDKHDLTLFTMQAEGFKVVGNGALYATTWIIEDIDGNVIWSVLKSTLYRTKIDVRDLILKPNSIYRLKAIFHSSSNDTSPVGCLTITTLNNDKLTVTKYLDVVDSTKDLELEINGIDGVKAVHWELIDYAGSIATTKWKATTDVTNENMWKTVVPRLTMKEGSVYLLKISTDVMDVGRKFIPFNTAVRTKTAEQEQQELLDKLVENTREAIISGTYLYGYKKNEINLGWLDKYGNKGRNDDDVGGHHG